MAGWTGTLGLSDLPIVISEIVTKCSIVNMCDIHGPSDLNTYLPCVVHTVYPWLESQTSKPIGQMLQMICLTNTCVKMYTLFV